MPTDDELFAIKERAAARLMAIPSVTAVGIGGRTRGGAPTGELVLKVYVQHKRPAAEVDPAELVPATFEESARSPNLRAHALDRRTGLRLAAGTPPNRARRRL
jgi:hypothetical protein